MQVIALVLLRHHTLGVLKRLFSGLILRKFRRMSFKISTQEDIGKRLLSASSVYKTGFLTDLIADSLAARNIGIVAGVSIASGEDLCGDFSLILMLIQK